MFFFHSYRISGQLTRPIFRRSVSSSAGESNDAKVASAMTATAAFKGAKSSRWRRFVLKPFIFVQFFFGIGLLAIALKQFRRKNTHPAQSPELIAKDWEVIFCGETYRFNGNKVFSWLFWRFLRHNLDPLLSYHPLSCHISRVGLVNQPSFTGLGATAASGKKLI